MAKFKIVTPTHQTLDKLIEGINILDSAVSSTLGPMGRNVVIETPYGAVTVTKDGVTVAKQIDLEDPVANLGAQIIKQAAAKTASLAGDGTTTSTVIASELVRGAKKLIAAGVPPIEIKRRFQTLLDEALVELDKQSKAVTLEKLKEIATISANNDVVIGTLISEAYELVGEKGLITLENSTTGSDTLEYAGGVSIDKSYASPYFITDSAKGEVVLENPLIFITDYKLRHSPDVIPALELAATANRPLLIIADEVEGQALQLCVVNKVRGVLSVAAIGAPSFGESRIELLKDLAALTSATILSKKSATRAEDVTPEDFGSAEKIIITKNKTIFIQPNRNEEEIAKRAKEIESQLTGENDLFMQNKLRKRLADLTAKVAIIKVGAATETELKEKKDRVDDALRATSCALQKGYVLGGGTTLAALPFKLNLSNSLIDPVFEQALQRPLRVIVENAGSSPDVILNAVLNSDQGVGYNARTHTLENLEEAGVIDPTIVVEQSLINAVSAASMVILSATAITNGDRTPPYSPGDLNDYTT